MKSSEVLRKAKKLIEKPENWTKRSFAKTKSGTCIWPENKLAVSFCSRGALINIAGVGLITDKSQNYLELTVPSFNNVVSFNNSSQTTHEDVMEAFKEAIILAEMDGD